MPDPIVENLEPCQAKESTTATTHRKYEKLHFLAFLAAVYVRFRLVRQAVCDIQ